MEKLNYLIEYLLKENQEIHIDEIPTNITEKKNLYRSLCNIRNPKPISNQYLKIEKEYLQQELKNKNITKAENIKPISQTIKKSNLKHKNKIYLWKGDIILQKKK